MFLDFSEQGIINGYGDSTFRPQNNITRAEFVTIIVNAFLTGEPSGEAVFTDVYEDAWYFDAVMLAFEKGIIKGVSETEFMPEENIRRQDMAVILKNLSVLMGKELPADVIEQVEITIRYEGYIERQQRQVDQFRKLEKKLIPADINYDDVSSLRLEARQKLEKFRPTNIGQASRIGGVNPADVSVLIIYLDSLHRGTENDK